MLKYILNLSALFVFMAVADNLYVIYGDAGFGYLVISDILRFVGVPCLVVLSGVVWLVERLLRVRARTQLSMEQMQQRAHLAQIWGALAVSLIMALLCSYGFVFFHAMYSATQIERVCEHAPDKVQSYVVEHGGEFPASLPAGSCNVKGDAYPLSLCASPVVESYRDEWGVVINCNLERPSAFHVFYKDKIKPCFDSSVVYKHSQGEWLQGKGPCRQCAAELCIQPPDPNLSMF